MKTTALRRHHLSPPPSQYSLSPSAPQGDHLRGQSFDGRSRCLYSQVHCLLSDLVSHHPHTQHPFAHQLRVPISIQMPYESLTLTLSFPYHAILFFIQPCCHHLLHSVPTHAIHAFLHTPSTHTPSALAQTAIPSPADQPPSLYLPPISPSQVRGDFPKTQRLITPTLDIS